MGKQQSRRRISSTTLLCRRRRRVAGTQTPRRQGDEPGTEAKRGNKVEEGEKENEVQFAENLLTGKSSGARRAWTERGIGFVPEFCGCNRCSVWVLAVLHQMYYTSDLQLKPIPACKIYPRIKSPIQRPEMSDSSRHYCPAWISIMLRGSIGANKRDIPSHFNALLRHPFIDRGSMISSQKEHGQVFM
jgi:hypothetical protein